MLPQNKEKQLANPSPEFLEELGRQWVAAQVNMPEQAQKANVRPMGSLESKLLGMIQGGEPSAMTYPNNTIAVNPSNNNIRGTLAHELTHVGQPTRGLTQFLKDRFTPYNQRPQEIEASNYEALYPWQEKGRDTFLPMPSNEAEIDPRLGYAYKNFAERNRMYEEYLKKHPEGLRSLMPKKKDEGSRYMYGYRYSR